MTPSTPPIEDARIRREEPPRPRPPRPPSVRLMLSHPAHLLSLGFGSGLSPVAPGTVGTLWAWGAYLVLSHWLTPLGWGVVLALGSVVGWWACTRTAQVTSNTGASRPDCSPAATVAR